VIKYALSCSEGHAFEAWFKSSSACDMQIERGLIACPVCGDDTVRKALMAPAGGGTKKDRAALPQAEADGAEEPAASPAGGGSTPAPRPAAMPVPMSAQTPGPNPQAVALATLAARNEKFAEVVKTLRAVRDKVVAESDYVGAEFAEEARRIHYDEAPDRAIYGEASVADVEALEDEGIDVMPLPVLPEDRN